MSADGISNSWQLKSHRRSGLPTAVASGSYKDCVSDFLQRSSDFSVDGSCTAKMQLQFNNNNKVELMTDWTVDLVDGWRRDEFNCLVDTLLLVIAYLIL